MGWGNVRRSMGPIRWWFFEREQRKLARGFGYDVGRHGARNMKDPTALSGKLDPELGAIFQEEYARGYGRGESVRYMVWTICGVLLLACAVGACALWVMR